MAWVSPASVTTGDLITAAQWNEDVVDNPLYLKTRADHVDNIITGWIAADDTWVYVSATSFKITGADLTTLYRKGTRVRWKDGGSYKYAYVVASSFSTDTTVTIAAGSDYSISNATLTDNYYSYDDSAQGFPDVFAYTPTGISASNVTLTGRFSILGRRCFVDFRCQFAGAISFTTMPTLPVTASASILGPSIDRGVTGVASYADSGTAVANHSISPTVIASGTTFGIYTAGGVAMGDNTPITWANNDEIIARFSYEI